MSEHTPHTEPDPTAGGTGAQVPPQVTPQVAPTVASQPGPPSQPTPAAPPRGIALASMVIGFASLLLIVLFLVSEIGIVPLALGGGLGLVAVIIGIVALIKRQSKGMAITGLIIGVFTMLFAGGLTLFALLFIGALVV